MKNIISYILMALMLFSCSDFLDYNEYDFLNKEDVLTNYNRVLGSVTHLYGTIPSGYYDVGGSMRDCATDDAFDVDRTRTIHYMNDGRWSAIRTVDNLWDAMYGGIRSANIFLQSYDLSLMDEYHYNDNYQSMYNDFVILDEQARFLRAYFYFELIRRYKNVPFLEDKILTLEEVNSVKQSSFDDIVNYIVRECDEIIPGLPVNYSGYTGDQNGRVTKGVAMALKARVLLYAASPLHNPENTQAKWIDAAKASWDIINSTWYSLEGNYSSVVNNSTSKELIFGRRRSAENSFEKRNFPIGVVGAAEPAICPTQNLVDCYRMDDGKNITDPTSGYDPGDPYANRDPRLLRTIIVNNSTWKSRIVEIWDGGRDGLPTQYATETGYYLKKYLVETINLDASIGAVTTALHCIVHFRYGEVLLNYAEAMNEAYGPTYSSSELGMSAYEAVHLIRARVGMPDFEDGLTQDQFQSELRDERRVELAFEDHRFWDIRRWKIGGQTTNINGIAVIKNSDGTFNYNTKTVETRTWHEKMNLYPIPQNEIFKNSNLVQNPDW